MIQVELSTQARDMLIDLLREECQFPTSGERRPWMLDAARALDPSGDTAAYIERSAYPEPEEEDPNV